MYCFFGLNPRLPPYQLAQVSTMESLLFWKLQWEVLGTDCPNPFDLSFVPKVAQWQNKSPKKCTTSDDTPTILLEADESSKNRATSTIHGNKTHVEVGVEVHVEVGVEVDMALGG